MICPAAISCFLNNESRNFNILNLIPPRAFARRKQGLDAARAGSSATGNGAARHYADEMSAVFSAGVDVGVERALRDRDVLDRVRSECAAQRRLHLGDTKHARSRSGYRDPHPASSAGDENADDRIARGRILEFHIASGLRLWQSDRGDDLGAVEGRLEHAGKEIVGGDLTPGRL